MNDARQLALKFFLFIGERLALLVIIVLGAIVFSTQKEATLAYFDNRSVEPQIISSIPLEKEPVGQILGAVEEQVPPSPTPTVAMQTPTPTPIPPTPTTTPPTTISPTPIITSTSTPTPSLAKTSPSPTQTPVLPTATPTPTPVPTNAPAAVDPNSDEVWDRLAICEAGGNWSIDTGNGYFGGLQFNQGAWESVGGTGNPAQASREEQITRGKMLQQKRGWGAWGGCSAQLGLN